MTNSCWRSAWCSMWSRSGMPGTGANKAQIGAEGYQRLQGIRRTCAPCNPSIIRLIPTVMQGIFGVWHIITYACANFGHKAIYSPTPAGNCPPPRLVERLNQGLAAGRTPGLALISASAGFGKTTLVSEWIAGCGDRSPGCHWMKGITTPFASSHTS